MTLDDDLVEVAGLLRVQAAEPEVVEDEQVRREQRADDALGGVVGPGLVDHPKHVVAAEEEGLEAGAAGAVSQGAGEDGLADADGSEEEHVLALLEKRKAEEITHAVAVEGDRRVPVEVLEGVRLREAGAVEAVREVLVLPPVDLVLKRELKEVEGSEPGLGRLGGPVGQDGDEPRELEPLEHGLERGFDIVHGQPPWGC